MGARIPTDADGSEGGWLTTACRGRAVSERYAHFTSGTMETENDF